MHWFNSFLVLLLMVCSAEAAYVVTQSGRQINGAKISASSNGSVTLTTDSGQSMTFRKGQYRQAVADKPAGLTKAEQLMKAGKGEQAVPLLRKVVKDYRFLGWDQTAALLLGNYLYDVSQFAEAVEAFQALENPEPAAQAKHRDALLKSGNLEQVLPALEKDIASGSREAAARAYLMRGDFKAANGDPAGARRDWLKVARFFKAQKELAQQAGEKLGNHEIHEPHESEGAGK
ncbi:tetratricopeptide repeat protein [Pontiella sulfatireligans]|uniref:Tetratricopeptide repeat protein n=1 Tax=Pontiella sulfatireligans TaxID=2750658 RepID=A0A6C2US82_9BACT|nr:hypothetical protein [Pontiella sulfatireligans]VGO21786.1 hypothetical protein SCARR_03863 [Pontiella sulfatireligans]